MQFNHKIHNHSSMHTLPNYSNYKHAYSKTLEIAEIVGAQRAYLKGGSPSCDREAVAGEVLKRGGIKVIRVP